MSSGKGGAQLAKSAMDDQKFRSELKTKLETINNTVSIKMSNLYKALCGVEDETKKNGKNKTKAKQTDNTNGLLSSINKGIDGLLKLGAAKSKFDAKLYDLLKGISVSVKDITSAQKDMVVKQNELTNIQKNVVKSKTGTIAIPEATIKKIGASVAKTQVTAVAKTQKAVAKKDKSKVFSKSLTAKGQGQVVTKTKSDSKKTKGKFGFSMSAFMKGLGKILKSIFNPVAMVLTFISKFLPYVLIFGAMLYGAWQAMGDELREKFKDIGLKILTLATAVFLGWKLIPLIIKGLAFTYHTLRNIFLIREHTAKMAAIGKETVMATTAHTAEMNKTIFGMLLEKIGFVFKKLVSAIEMVLNGIVFAIRCAVAVAGFLLIAAIVIVIVGLIVLIIKAMWDMFGDTILKFFSFIGDMVVKVLDKTVEFIKILINGIIGVVKWIFKKLFGIGDSDDNKDKNKEESETTIKNGVTPQIYFAGVAAIIEPLRLLNDKMAKMIKLQTSTLAAMHSQAASSMIGALSMFTPMGAMTHGTSAINGIISSVTAKPNDDTETQLVTVTAKLDTINESSDDMLKKLDDINENIKVIIGNQIALSNETTLHRPRR